MNIRKVAGVTPLDESHHKRKPPLWGGVQLKASIDVQRSPETCYRYWRDFSHLPAFMEHLQMVEEVQHGRSHWMVDGPADTTVEWDAELLEDIPNERISWRSVENAQVDNAGSVLFSPLEQGRKTRIKVTMTYNPTLGLAGEWVSHLFGETPDQELADDLSRFKEMIERAA